MKDATLKGRSLSGRYNCSPFLRHRSEEAQSVYILCVFVVKTFLHF